MAAKTAAPALPSQAAAGAPTTPPTPRGGTHPAAIAAEPASWSTDCKVTVWRTGRFWRPWECSVHHGPMIFGEAGCDWSAWTRQRAIRKGLRVIAGYADFELERGRPTTAIIEERAQR